MGFEGPTTHQHTAKASSASFVPKKSSKSFVAFGELLFPHKKQHHGSSAENNVSSG